MTALLFERDRVDEVDWTGSLPRLGRSSLLWIDLEKPSEAELSALSEVLDLDADTAQARADHRD